MTDVFPFSRSELRKAGVQDESKAVVGTIHGERNAPTIPDGATVGIYTADTEITHEGRYLLTVNGQERISQILRLEGDRFMLRSDNPDKELYPDEIYDSDRVEAEQVTILGRLFWVSWFVKSSEADNALDADTRPFKSPAAEHIDDLANEAQEANA